MFKLSLAVAATSLIFTSFAFAAPTLGVKTMRFTEGLNTLSIEILNDKIIHFELTAQTATPMPVYLSPYVDTKNFDKNFSGPSKLTQKGATLETASLQLNVEAKTLCVTITDKSNGVTLNKICPTDLEQAWKGLKISKNQMTDVYGLGQQFLDKRIGTANGNWIGEVRSPGDAFGNAMRGFNGGATGNTQFPVMYAVGPNSTNYALFLDNVYVQNWDFQKDPWTVQMMGDQIRWFMITGADLPELRTSFMQIVGRPLVPPKKAFGLWVSEFGFDSWDEIQEKLKTLRANKFPIDGFVMDLQWFGGVTGQSENSPMGTLRFDESKFPNPASAIKNLRDKDGVGIITIEESYVSRGLAEHAEMESKGFLARESEFSQKAFYINENPWWGLGGMVDWSNPEAGKKWHDWKRQPLVDMGIVGHWTDLGEPEMYHNTAHWNETPWYYGFPELGKSQQADVHNVYALKWHESIFDGYQRNQVQQRPWILSRSGGPGIQRYGAVMWSADIGSNLSSLASHSNVQMHMSFSGIDYFGSDIGGFHRSGMALDYGTDLNEMYTQWFANGTAFDVPIRPHTENLANNKETSPDRIGNIQSNLANLRLRYELSPYYYSLAHRAYLYGEPVVPPVVYYYQDAPSLGLGFDVRTMGSEKLIGRDLLFAIVAKNGERSRSVYLPQGEWVDYYNGTRYTGHQLVNDYPEYVNGIFRLPLFVRAGAILPKMFVDDKTLNISGRRSDGTVRNELIARIYTGEVGQAYSFTVYEDDGWSSAYQNGEVATTLITQQKESKQLNITVENTEGTYAGAPETRAIILEVAPTKATAAEVLFNGKNLKLHVNRDEFDKSKQGWILEAGGTVLIKTESLPMTSKKKFIVRF